MRSTGAPQAEAAALAAVALSSFARYRQDDAGYGAAPGGVSESDFVDAWVDTWHAAICDRTDG